MNVPEIPAAPQSWGGGDFFGEPTPLVSAAALPAFPTDAFPPSLRDMVREVAEATQTDEGMAGTSSLSVIAAAAGGVRLEVSPGWEEGLNLYTVTVASPGERKSSVQRHLTAPLSEAERRLADATRDERVEAATLQRVARQVAEEAARKAGRTQSDDRAALEAEAIAAEQHAQQIVVPAAPRLVVDDVTPEALVSIMAEQGGRIALISAEGGIFDTMAGRYSGRIPVLDPFLKGHSGDQLRVDRRGREPEYIDCPALTMSLMVQPRVLERIAADVEMRGRGLLARVLYCVPPSRLGHRKVDPAPVSAASQEAYRAMVIELALHYAASANRVVLRMAGDARARIRSLAAEVEPQLGPAGELSALSDWGGKYVGAVCRMAGLLHVAHHRSAATQRPVSADTVAAAVEIGEYYRQHALRAFDLMKADPVSRDAEHLFSIIRARAWTNFSHRDLFSAVGRSRFRKSADLSPGLERLIDYGWIAPVEVAERDGRRGRRPSKRYLVHPSAISAESA